MSGEKMKGYIGSFLIGGALGIVGHAIIQFYTFINIPIPINFLLGIYTLALIGAIFTFIGPYSILNKYGGVGAALPMCGLTNGIAGMIYGARCEGQSTGKALKFGLTGPAKIFGSGFALGLILAGVSLMMN